MSAETSTWLNTQTLIGMTANRGNAWHYRAEDQGAEDNHYQGAIPVGDVTRRLFNWQPLSVPVSITLPATYDDMTTVDAEGRPVKILTVPDRQAIVHPHTLETFGVFKDGYTIHSYQEWLLNEVSNILSDTLSISSAGLLRGGAIAWVEVSVPETIETPEGVTFRPNLLAATSLDGSLSTTYKRTVTNTVCDNTMGVALGEDGQQIKIKHSRYSAVKLTDARAALAMVERTADQFEERIRSLTATEVTPKQWAAFLDEINPIPAEKGRARTNAAVKQDALTQLWSNDHRVAPWNGTAWGVVQAINTYEHHIIGVRGVTRGERNMQKAVTGSFDKLDADTMNALNKVLVTA